MHHAKPVLTVRQLQQRAFVVHSADLRSLDAFEQDWRRMCMYQE